MLCEVARMGDGIDDITEGTAKVEKEAPKENAAAPEAAAKAPAEEPVAEDGGVPTAYCEKDVEDFLEAVDDGKEITGVFGKAVSEEVTVGLGIPSCCVGTGMVAVVKNKTNKCARRRRQHLQHVVDLFLSARAMYVARVELMSTYADKAKAGTLHDRFPSPNQAAALAVEVVSVAVEQARAVVFTPWEVKAVTASVVSGLDG